MTIIIPIIAILCGMAASILYVLVTNGWIYGVTAPFLPLFLIAGAGMVYGRAGVSVASAVTAFLLLFLIDFQHALLITVTQLVPITLCIRALMMAVIRPHASEPSHGLIMWAPLSAGVLAMACYAAFYLMVLIATDNSLYHTLTRAITLQAQQFNALEPAEMAAQAQHIITSYPHMVLALEFWAWSAMCIAVILLAHYVVDSFGLAKRPQPSLGVHSPPTLLLGAIAGCAALTLVDIPAIMHGAQAAVLVLLLPYFIFGLGYIHRTLRRLKHGQMWLVGFYIFVMLSFWPLIIITLLGLMRHISHVGLAKTS